MTIPNCPCGRSPTGKCIGLHKLTNEEYQQWLIDNPLEVLTEETFTAFTDLVDTDEDENN